MSPKAADFFLLRTASLEPSSFDSVRAGFASDGFLRSPIFQDAFFREAVFLASTNLGQRMDDPSAESDENFCLSVARYLNRMAFRPTPFGIFAGVSLGLAGSECELRIMDAESSTRIGRLDQGILSDIHAGLLSDLDQKLPILRRASLANNNSAWVAPDGLRFIEAVRDDGHLHYRLSKVEFTAPIAHVRAFVGSDERPFTQIVGSLVAEFQIEREQAETFVTTLAEEQILIVSPQIAITGEDSVMEFVTKLERLSPDTPSLQRVAKAQAILNGIGTDAARNLGSYQEVVAELEAADTESTKVLQVDLYRPSQAVTLPQKILDEIVAETWNLRALLTGPPQDDTRNFATEFAERHGDAKIPLLEVLDADFGIPFGTASQVQAPLLDGMKFGAHRSGNAPRLDEAAFALAQKAWLTHSREITLDDAYLSKLAAQTPLPPLPSFTVFGSLAAASCEALSKGEYEFVLGGLSPLPAMALLGRFCLGDRALAQKVRQFIESYEADTDDVIVAEVVHTPEGRAANILLRPVLRQHEIVYMGKSGAPIERQIPASDLHVSCQNGQIVLTSEKSGKRVIPRITNAHAFYAERNVPIYKFLGMLQLQNTAAMRDPWGEIAETAKFLPALKYRHIRVCPAKWRLDRDDLREMLKGGADDISGILKPLLNAGDLRKIRVRAGDNFIELDLDHRLDRAILLEEARRSAGLTIEEIPPGNTDMVCDTGGRKLRHEIVVPVSCHHPAATSQPMVSEPPAKAAHHPGEDWLYARIFCGPTTMDRLISDVFPAFADDAAATGCDRPFFIRYWQNGQHLRLRAHGNPDRLQALQSRFEQRLQPYLKSREVSRFEYATYFPEYHRYGGPLGLPLCETFFSADSDCVSAALRILAEASDKESARWHFALTAMFHLLRAFDLGHDAESAIITPMVEGYSAEFHLDKTQKGQLNEKYREHRAMVDEVIRGNAGGSPTFAHLIETRRQHVEPIARELKNLTSVDSLATIVQSLMHMCANKIFPEQARQHELLLLHFISKSAASIRGRQRYDQKFAASQEQ